MPTFAQIADRYISKREYNWANSTKVTYTTHRNNLVEILKGRDLSSMEPDDIEDLAKALLQKELSPRKVKETLQFFKAVASAARKNKVSVCEFDIPVLKSAAKPPLEPPTRAEIHIIIQNIDPQFQSVFYFLMDTGCRPNEAKALRWSDVHEGHADIYRGRVRGVEGSTKTGNCRRVPLSAALKNILADLRKVSNSEYVFVGKRGNPINGHLDRIWRHACASAGIAKSRSYELRHSFVTTAMENGVSPAYVSRVIGHRNLSMTMNRYYGVTDTGTEEARLQQHLGGR